MRVLVVSYFYPPEIGAPALRMRAITQAFVRRGWAVDVITGMPQYPVGRTFPDYRGRLWRTESFLGARVYRVFTYPTQRLGPYRLASYLSHAIAASILGVLWRRRWDVVFLESPPLFVGLVGLWLSAIKRVPFALDVTDLWPDSARELGLVTNPRLLAWGAKLEQALYRRAWRISCATNGIADRLRSEKGVPEPKIDLLPNGVDPEVFAPGLLDREWRGKLGVDDRKIFVYAGLHGYAQGLRVILDSARLLKRERDIGFVLMGDGPARADLVSVAKRERLDNVSFLPPAPEGEAARVLALSYASVVPLLNVPLMEAAVPSKVITSLATGVPVVLSGTGEAAKLLTTHACGLVAEPENPEALARAIRWLSTHPGERERLGRNGLSLVHPGYHWDQLTNRWLTRWESLASGTSPATPPRP